MNVPQLARQTYNKLKDDGKLKIGMWYVLYGDELLTECNNEQNAIDWTAKDCKMNNRKLSYYVIDHCGYERENLIIHIN